jgi:hypothetical protein
MRLCQSGQGRDDLFDRPSAGPCREQVDVDMIAPGAAAFLIRAMQKGTFLQLEGSCVIARGSTQQTLGTGLNTALMLIKAIDDPEHCPRGIAKESSVLTMGHPHQAGQAISRWWPRSHRLQAITCRIKREIHLTSAKKLLFVQEERADQALGCKSRSDSGAM